MASATVGILKVLLTANTAEFDAAMKRASNTADKFSKDMRSVGTQAQSVGRALTQTITLPIVGLAAASIKAAMDFESSFANVAKTVDGVSDKSGKLTKSGTALANAFRQLAKEIPATTDELNAIAAMGGQMGVPIQRLEKFTKNIAALGVAVDGISAEEATMGLAQIANVFGDKEVRNIDKMSSALVHLGNNSNATEGQILEFTKRLSGAGRSAGMSIPDIMALGTAMANVGLNAEAGGTAMSQMIAKMSEAVSTGGAKLEAFDKIVAHTGRSFSELWSDSPIKAVDAVVQGLGRAQASGADLNLVVKDIGATGIRTAATMKQLAGAGDGIATSLITANEGWATGNKHLEEAEKKYATTANQLKILWNQIRDVGMTLGAALLPGVKSLTSMMSGLIPVIDKVAGIFGMMPGPLQALVVGLGLAVAAAGPMLFIFGSLLRAAADVTAAFGKKGIATKLLAADMSTLTGAASKSATALGLLGKAAAIAGAAFVGWQVGRLISDLFSLDKQIADTLTHLNELKVARGQVATGGQAGREAVLADLTKKEQELALAIQQGNKALAARLRSEIAAVKNDQTRMAMLDTLNRAIAAGADKNITYANAVTFLQQKEAERQAGLKAQAEAQQSANRATETAEQKTNRLKEAQAQITAANQKYAQELTGIKDVLALQIRNMDVTGLTVEKLAGQYEISKETVERFKKELEGSTKAHKDAEKAATAAEKAAAKHAATLQKQADALQQLGVVTENQVLKSLDELNTLIQHAVDAGVPLEAVLKAIAPRLEDLRKKAQDSGVSVEMLAEHMERLRRIGEAALDGIANSIPPVVRGLSQLPGKVLDINRVMNVADIQAQNTTDSFKFFGLSTRAELERTARDAVTHYNTIKASGTATPEQIREAFEKMQKALRDVSGKVKEDWLGAFESILGAVARMTNGVVQAFADAARNIVATFRNLPNMSRSQRVGGATQGALALWTGTGQEGQSTAQSTITGLGSGASTGAMIGSFFGPGGTVAGLVIGGVVGGLVGYFRGRAANNEHKKVNDARDEFFGEFGGSGTGPGSGFHELGRQLSALGPLGDQIFKSVINAKTMEEFEAATRAANAALENMRGELAHIAQNGGLASQSLIRYRDAMRDTAEVQQFIRAETQTAASSFNAFLQAGADAYTTLSDLQKKYADASGDDRDKLAKEIEKQQRLINAIAITPASTLDPVRAAMDPEELAALFEAYQEAVKDGFKGSQDEFLRQQLGFYQTLEEGDERLKTWFSGATMDAFDKGAQARLDAAKAAMDPTEIEALSTAYEKAVIDGYAGTRDEFLRRQLDLYGVLEEGDERLKTWFSASTMDAYAATGAPSSAGAFGAALAGTFGALMEQGMSAREALKQLEPGIAALRVQLDATGLSGGAAFESMERLAGIVTSEIGGPALDAITHLTRGLQAAHNAGFLTQEMFTGLTTEIMQSRQAMIDQGASSEDVNRLMQRDLQTLWQLRKDFNYQVDETTGLLLDEAEAAGTVGDQYRSAMDRAAIAMEKAANAIIKALGGAGDAAEEFGKRVDKATRPRTLRVDYDVEEPPDTGQPSYGYRGGIVTAAGIIPRYMGLGGPVSQVLWKPKGRDTVPAMLAPEEVVLTEANTGNIANSLQQAMAFVDRLKSDLSAGMPSFSPMPGTNMRPAQSTTIMEVDKREIGRVVADVLPLELRRLGVRVRS